MSHDDFAIEPVPGLPEVPPEGERILWQGKPDWWALAREAMAVHWVAAYFAALALWRGTVAWGAQGPEAGLGAVAVLLIMGAAACGLIVAFAWIQARATVYTITNRRVAMRIGAALTVTLNLPYRWIGSADLKPGPRGTGTIAFDLIGETRFSYLVCWPHVRPWRMAKTQPALRAIPDAALVAGILAENARAAVTRGVPEAAAMPQGAGSGSDAIAAE